MIVSKGAHPDGDHLRVTPAPSSSVRGSARRPTRSRSRGVLAQPFPTIAVIGPHSVEHLRSSLEALEVRLSADELRWLNLEA